MKYLDFKVTEDCEHSQDTYEIGCPLCKIGELDAQVVDAILDCSTLHVQNTKLQAKLDQWNKHEAAEEPAELYFNEVYGIGSMRDQYKIAELQEQVDRECVWTRVNNSYSCWDEYDAWSTSCGEDYAIEEEWDDKVPNFCGNCGGKAKEALEQKP